MVKLLSPFKGNHPVEVRFLSSYLFTWWKHMAAVWVSVSLQVPTQLSHFKSWCTFTNSSANSLKWNQERKWFFLRNSCYKSSYSLYSFSQFWTNTITLRPRWLPPMWVVTRIVISKYSLRETFANSWRLLFDHILCWQTFMVNKGWIDSQTLFGTEKNIQILND